MTKKYYLNKLSRTFFFVFILLSFLFSGTRKTMAKNPAEDFQKDVFNAGVILGLHYSANGLYNFCKPTGTIPYSAINKIKSFNLEPKVEPYLIKAYTSAGYSRDQAKAVFKQAKESIITTMDKMFEADFLAYKKMNPSGTKLDYCTEVEKNADNFVQYKINIIKNGDPELYRRFFNK